MKLFSPVLLLTAALVAAGAHANDAIQKRDIFDDLSQGFQDVVDGIGGAINIGHDGDESESNTPTSIKSTPSQSPSQSVRSTSSSTSSKKSTSSSTSQKPTSSAQSLTTDSGDSAKNSTTSTTTSSPSPTPTGEACTGNGKRCPTVGENTYQQCLNKVWTNQKCGNSLVCGLDGGGSVACMSKEQATVVYDKCTGDAKRCHPTESTKYQQCNGSYWATFTCDNSSKCSLDGNKNVICGSSSGSGGSSSSVTYSLVKPQPFVPESAAPLSAKLTVGAIAVALVAAALGMPSLGF
ncbi:hypothetical protein GGI19_004664 [Coemansia pectinata]|uniref:Uncharacterized protein n=1 Tax=Coemansia pectinata TaxID=1052879 RepID=A0A9W8LAC7_9FUNG|nr:hypothetical protein GGI19_004664 [Coemansia pectinata]